LKALWRSFRYLRPYLLLALVALLGLGLSSAGNLIVPAISQRIIDQGITEGRRQVVLTLAAAIVGIAVLQAIFTFLQGYLTARVSQGVAYDLRNDLYSKIQSLSFSYHDKAQTGQLLTRATSDVNLVQQFLGSAILQILGGLILLVGSLVLMFATSPRTALVLIVMGPVAVAIFGFFFLKARPLFSEAQKRLSALNVALEENLLGVRVVRAFVRRDYESSRFAERNRAVRDLHLKVGRIIAVALPLIFFVANAATLGVTWIGGIQVINAAMTLGELVAFSNYILLAIFPIFMLSFSMVMAAQAAAGAERIFEVLDAPTDIVEREDAIPLPALEGRVAFEDVWFRYFEHQPWILQAITFVAEPGQKIALLGATGSGKSTVTNLIPRFYDVTKGRVTIDGHDVRDLTLESLRRQVGIVLQETLLFAGTIRENIAFGRPDASSEEVQAAAEAAQAHAFIAGFPDGYDTQVGERGVTLSGGQKQRIAIARALLVDPGILILDDAMSNVDFQTELKLRRALETLMQGPTSFIIAQRVSTVQDADLILVLDEGRVAAQGSHEDLLERSPLYADIYYGQLEGDAQAEEDFLVYGEDVAEEVTS
jgi:ATP-binding cassette, subfamily B, multidrug efflux pump